DMQVVPALVQDFQHFGAEPARADEGDPHETSGWYLNGPAAVPAAGGFDTAVLRRNDKARLHPTSRALPARGGQPLLRAEALLVGHLARAADPVAEIEIGQAHRPGPQDVVENDPRAQAPRRLVGIVER